MLAPLSDQTHNDADDTTALENTLDIAGFLHDHIYGCSRVPSLTALLQREIRPVPPLPFRCDSLLIRRPNWLDSRIDGLLLTLQQRQAEADEQAAVAVAMEEQADH